VEREFSLTKHMYIIGIHKKCCARRNAVLEDSRVQKLQNFLNMEKNYLNFEETRNNGNAVSHKMLHLRTREIVRSLIIAKNEFKASRGWIDRFMK
jgi:hypothetical protein